MSKQDNFIDIIPTLFAILQRNGYKSPLPVINHIRNFIKQHPEKDISEIVKHLKQGLPYEYVINEAIFCNIPIYVTPEVLIPRIETEKLVSETLSFIKERHLDNKKTTHIDIGCGSGAISRAILQNTQHLHSIATDISTGAISIAKKNLKDFKSRSTVIKGNLLEGFLFKPGRSYIITANLPYIPKDTTLPTSVIDHEPHIALFGGVNGFDLYTRLFEQLAQILSRSQIDIPYMIFEIDSSQKLIAKQKAELLYKFRFTSTIKKDLFNKPRYLLLFRT